MNKNITKFSASEALFAFCGWLTSRDESLTMGASHNAVPTVDAIDAFMLKYKLDDVRDGWDDLIVRGDDG